MSALAIDRWKNTFRARRRIPAEQLRHWQNGLEQLQLDSELDALVGSEEWVLIRRLQLKTRLNEDQSEAEATETWRHALNHELRELIENEHSDIVVRYRNRRDAVCDMLYRSACGDLSRVWAWEQMNLLPHGNAHSNHPGTILTHAVHHLLAEPEAIWPLLTRLISAEAHTGALTVLIRKLPALEFNDLLAFCPQTRPYQRMDRQPVYTPKQENIRLQQTPLVCLLMSWISDHPWLLQEHLHEVMVLLAAASHPADDAVTSTSDQFATQTVLAASRALMDEYFHPRSSPKTRHPRAEPSVPVGKKQIPLRDSQTTHDQAALFANADQLSSNPLLELTERRVNSTQQMPPAPTLPHHDDIHLSQWGGLLFLLHLIPATELMIQLDRLSSELKLPADIGRRVLWQLATQYLHIPSSDPAVRAFCGGWQPESHQLDDQGFVALPIVLELIVSDTAQVIRTLLAELLPNNPELSLEAICRRNASIHFEPGWIEIHMSIDQADSRIRRVALDLDPGWTPWLGCVMRFIYE